MDFKKGFTLVEMIVGFGLVGIVSVLVAALYFTNFKLFSNQNTSIDVNSQNRLAIDNITNQIRESMAVAASCCSPTETAGSNELVLQLWPTDTNGDPTDPGASNYDYIIYKLDSANSTITKQTVPASGISHRTSGTKVLAVSLATNGLQFTYAPDNTTPSTATEIIVSIVTTGTAAGKTQTVIQTTSATLRNK